jgi:hypothetical protein
MMHKLMIIAAIGTIAIGCKKKKEEAGGTSDKGGAAANLPALTAEPDPGAITAAEKPPFEAVTFRMNGKRGSNGWPKYDLYNLSTKPVTFAAIYGYAYDKDGKQIARTKVPLSWNGNAAPGTKVSFDIEIGTSPDDKLPAGAAAYAVCYNSIKFEGDADMTSDNAKCPEQMPKT